jgi:hypothetical protein
LLQHACASALGEKPDMLVVVGGPRTARRAGQLAYRTGTPILFLPGVRSATWAQHLWGSLSLEDMVAAIARGNLTPVRLGAGLAHDQIFFGKACFGLLAHLPQLRQAFQEADTFAEGWQVVTRGAQLSRFVVAPNLHFRSDDTDRKAAKGLTVDVPAPERQLGNTRTYRPSFECSATRYGAFGLIKALMGRRSDVQAPTDRFGCFSLQIGAEGTSWILLDEEPIRFHETVKIRFVSGAIQTFIFNPNPQFANDNPMELGMRFRSFCASEEPDRNLDPFPPVSLLRVRESGNHGRQG